MLSRLAASLLVMLCVLPTTAPFSVVDASAFPVPHGAPVLTPGAPVSYASVDDADQDAVALPGSTFLRESPVSAANTDRGGLPRAAAFIPEDQRAPVDASLGRRTSPSIGTILRV